VSCFHIWGWNLTASLDWTPNRLISHRRRPPEKNSIDISPISKARPVVHFHANFFNWSCFHLSLHLGSEVRYESSADSPSRWRSVFPPAASALNVNALSFLQVSYCFSISPFDTHFQHLRRWLGRRRPFGQLRHQFVLSAATQIRISCLSYNSILIRDGPPNPFH